MAREMEMGREMEMAREMEMGREMEMAGEIEMARPKHLFYEKNWNFIYLFCIMLDLTYYVVEKCLVSTVMYCRICSFASYLSQPVRNFIWKP